MEAKDKMDQENTPKNGADSEIEMDDSSLPEVETKSENEGEPANLQNELLYLKAEFDNYKKRILREQDQAIRFGNEKLVKELLNVVDHLDLATLHGKDQLTKGKTQEKDFANLLSGIEMTQRQLSQLLTRFGVEFIGAVGETFDPSRHEAISQIESAEAKENTVLQVLQRGSLLQGRLLAPAKVVVAKSNKES